MLSKLHISNYALIDELEINFNKGLTIITGETGAGKSIIMGALSLILGERADVRSIRDTSRKAIVEATFDITGYALQPFFRQNDIEYYEDECIMRKEFAASGRSRTFVNDVPVPLSTLKELSQNIIDIHSQHSNLLVFKPAYQLSIIDNLADDRNLLQQYSAKHKLWQQKKRELDTLRKSVEKNRADEDYIRFQLEQLQQMRLVPGEDDELESLQKRLSNVTEIKEALWQAESLLRQGDTSIVEQLKEVTRRITAAAENMDEAAEYAQRLDSTLIELNDIAQSISTAQDTLECDPDELQRVTDRLNAIYSLQSKHRVATVQQLIDIQKAYEQRIENIDNSDENIAELEREEQETYAAAKAIAAQLTGIRRKSAASFVTALEATTLPLGLKNLKFAVNFSERELSDSGADTVQFVVAFNKNQSLMALEDTASGGELSRLMLSIKSIIAKSMKLPTIIFDEVDTGVSGDVADKIGEMMWRLSDHLQVIAITHLPQVAARGDNHIKVYKTDTDNATVTTVTTLSPTERVNEIAAMLSGENIGPAAIENAKALLQANKNKKI